MITAALRDPLSLSDVRNKVAVITGASGAFGSGRAVALAALEVKVLLLSSVRGRHGNISGNTACCASKGAADSLTRVLAREWAKYGITVNAVGPTVFRSRLTAWMYGDGELGRATKDYCTGQVTDVDGGFTAA